MARIRWLGTSPKGAPLQREEGLALPLTMRCLPCAYRLLILAPRGEGNTSQSVRPGDHGASRKPIPLGSRKSQLILLGGTEARDGSGAALVLLFSV